MAVSKTASATSILFRDGDDSFTKAPWVFKPSDGGIAATPGNGFVNYAVASQSGRNLWCALRLEEPYAVPAGGLVMSTRFKLDNASGSESKFNLPGGVILRVTDNGNTPAYLYYQSGWHNLSTSAVTPGSGWHVVSLVFQQTSTTLFEDGKLMFTWERSNAEGVKFDISSQLLDDGAAVSMCVGDYRIAPLSNVALPAALVFTEGTDLTAVPWVQQPNPNGPRATAAEGYVRFDDEQQDRRNMWTRLMTTCTFALANGCSFNFRVRIDTRSSEVKLTLPGDIILRWTGAGRTAQYAYYAGGFRTLGQSSATTGAGWTDVTLVYQADTSTVYENGKRLFVWDHANGSDEPFRLDMQVLDAGSATTVDISNVGINEGIEFYKSA